MSRDAFFSVFHKCIENPLNNIWNIQVNADGLVFFFISIVALNYIMKYFIESLVIKIWDQEVYFLVISGLNPIIANIIIIRDLYIY